MVSSVLWLVTSYIAVQEARGATSRNQSKFITAHRKVKQ